MSKPTFTTEYTPPTTIAEADADLLAILRLARKLTNVSMQIRGDAPNMKPSKTLLEFVRLDIERALLTGKMIFKGEDIAHGE